MRPAALSERALVLAPLGRDAAIATAMLGEAGVSAEACASLPAMVQELDRGVGLVVATEEALGTADLAPLAAWIADQEQWSDLPFVLLTRQGGGLERNPAAKRYLDVLGNATFIERPFHPTTLISLAQSALRGRRRQYEARQRLEDLRQSEARLRFLDRLAGATQPLTDPTAVMAVTARLLGEHLGVSVCAYADMEPDQDGFTIRGDWAAPGAASIVGFYSLSGFGERAVRELRAGRPLVTRDTLAELGPQQASLFLQLGLKATVCMPLLKEGRLVALMAVHDSSPRDWSEAELSLVADTTERSWAYVERVGFEAALRDSEARFRAAVGAVQGLLWTNDASGRMVGEQPGWAALTGQSYDEYQGYGWAGAVHPEDAEPTIEAWTDAVASRTSFVFEHRVRRHDGEWRSFAVRAVPVIGADGAIREWVGVHRDVTEARQAEAALRASETRYRTLFEAIDAGFCIVEMEFDSEGRAEDYRFVEVNPAFERQAGFAGAIGRRMRELVPSHEQHWFDIYGRVATSGEPARFEEGSAALGRWWDVHAFRVGEAEQRRVAVLFNDITERRRAELALRELNTTLERRVAEALAERKLLADIVGGTDAFVQVVDHNYRWLAINKAAANEFERIFGARPQVGDSMLDLLAHRPEHQAAVRAVWGRALGGEEFTEVGEFGDPALDRRFYEMKFNVLRGPDGGQIGAYQFVYDVTRRVRDEERLLQAEEQLRQSQKMEAVGQLTGGVAHDFNNLLTIIKSSTELLRRPDLSEDRRRRYVDAISDTVDRASKLTGQLLAFARRQALKPEVFDVAERVRAVTDMLRTIVGSRIRIATDVECEACFVEADLAQFETALVNLTVNARDAMGGEGALTLRVKRKSEIGSSREPSPSRGGYIAVSIEDTGVGIPPDRLDQIFEPFYTTKEVGKGTGLGLSQVYGFAKQSGGDVAVESELGRGSVFTLYLRQAESAPPDEASAPAKGAVAVEDGRGRRVLVVEDNEDVGTFSTQLLRDLGYETTLAANADEALRALAGANGFDVVFSDVVMPGASGVELGLEIRRRHPGMPVVLTSGYSHVLAEEGRHGFELLHKPYAVEELSRVLRRAMIAAAPRPRQDRDGRR